MDKIGLARGLALFVARGNAIEHSFANHCLECSLHIYEVHQLCMYRM